MLWMVVRVLLYSYQCVCSLVGHCTLLNSGFTFKQIIYFIADVPKPGKNVAKVDKHFLNF